jgi:hypothetical protein
LKNPPKGSISALKSAIVVLSKNQKGFLQTDSEEQQNQAKVAIFKDLGNVFEQNRDMLIGTNVVSAHNADFMKALLAQKPQDILKSASLIAAGQPAVRVAK